MDRRRRFGGAEKELMIESQSSQPSSSKSQEASAPAPAPAPRSVSGTRPRARKAETTPSCSPLSSAPSSSSSSGLSEGEEYTEKSPAAANDASRPKARPKARALAEPPKAKGRNNGKRKASASAEGEIGEEHREDNGNGSATQPTAKTKTGIRLPPKLPKPAPVFHSINLPAKVSYEEGPSARQSGSVSSKDPLMTGIQAQVSNTFDSREMSFGPGRRVLSSSSIFSTENFSESASLLSSQPTQSQPGPSTPTKKARTGIVLPSKNGLGKASQLSSQESHDDGIKPSEEPESHWDMLIAASQSGAKASPRQRQRKEVKVPTEVRLLRMCPFCEAAMPRRVSLECCEMMQPWLDRYHAGKPIKVTDTAAVCEKHRAESDIIPRGKKQGWPTTLDLDKLAQRLEDGQGRHSMTELLQAPRDSPFFKSALERRMARTNKMDRSPAEILDVQAGYYGETGYEILRKTLTSWFYFQPLDEASNLQSATLIEAIKPLTSVEFVGDVLVPELACRLIIEDYDRRKGVNKRILSFEEAREIKLDSATYGIAMFPAEGAGAGDDLFAKGGQVVNKTFASQTSSPSAGRRAPSMSSVATLTASRSPRRTVDTAAFSAPTVTVKARARPLYQRSPSSSAPTPLGGGSALPATGASTSFLDTIKPVRPRPAHALSQPVGSSGASTLDESRRGLNNRSIVVSDEEKGADNHDGNDDDDFWDRSRQSLSSKPKRPTPRHVSNTQRIVVDLRDDNDDDDDDLRGWMAEKGREEAALIPSRGERLAADQAYGDGQEENDTPRTSNSAVPSTTGATLQT